jgi:hypothetical protein
VATLKIKNMKKLFLFAIVATCIVLASCEKESGFNVTIEATSETPGFIINDGVNGVTNSYQINSKKWSKSITSENGNIYSISAKSLDSNAVLTVKIKFNKNLVEYETGKNYVYASYVTFN